MWAVNILSNMVSSSRVVISGRMWGECGSQFSYRERERERRYVIEGILTGVIVRHRRTLS